MVSRVESVSDDRGRVFVVHPFGKYESWVYLGQWFKQYGCGGMFKVGEGELDQLLRGGFENIR